MKERIQQLEKEFKEAKESLQRMRDKLNRLRDSEQEFEEGQWYKIETRATGIEWLTRVDKVESSRVWGYIIDLDESDWYGYEFHRKNEICSSRPATDDEIKEALVAEAKRRFGEIKDGDKFISLHGCKVPICLPANAGKWRYYEGGDELSLHSFTLYKQGQWAEPIEDTVTINGVECEVGDNFINLSCGGSIYIGGFRNFYEIVHEYDLTVTRKGEDITPQIKKLGEQI